MRIIKVFSASLALALSLGACDQNNNNQLSGTATGALAGSALGAGLGAIVGHQTGHTGGGIAIGHPLGATGARITGKAAALLKREGKSLALATQCIGGGQGIATILEAV